MADALYAIVLGTPASAEIELDHAPDVGAQVHLLGHDQPLDWQPTDAGCRVTLPGQPADAPALTLKIR